VIAAVNAAEVQELVRTSRIIRGVDFSGLELADLVLEDKVFWLCNLPGIRMRRVRLHNVKVRLSFFDFGEFERCQVVGCDIRNSVFAGSRLTACRVEESNLHRVSFVGVDIRESLFLASDLYASRFTSSRVEGVTFRDCNLKRVQFRRALVIRTDFPASNPREAYMAEALRR
jgi:uncharacterized protein YjbI with pentapeptide repeats